MGENAFKMDEKLEDWALRLPCPPGKDCEEVGDDPTECINCLFEFIKESVTNKLFTFIGAVLILNLIGGFSSSDSLHQGNTVSILPSAYAAGGTGCPGNAEYKFTEGKVIYEPVSREDFITADWQDCSPEGWCKPYAWQHEVIGVQGTKVDDWKFKEIEINQSSLNPAEPSNESIQNNTAREWGLWINSFLISLWA